MDEILRDLAVLLADANAAVAEDSPRAPKVMLARRRLCVALGIELIDETPEQIAGKLRKVAEGKWRA